MARLSTALLAATLLVAAASAQNVSVINGTETSILELTSVENTTTATVIVSETTVLNATESTVVSGTTTAPTGTLTNVSVIDGSTTAFDNATDPTALPDSAHGTAIASAAAVLAATAGLFLGLF